MPVASGELAAGVDAEGFDFPGQVGELAAAVLAAPHVGVEAEGVSVAVVLHEVYDALLVCLEMLVFGSFYVGVT